jgi:hypothetical protein
MFRPVRPSSGIQMHTKKLITPKDASPLPLPSNCVNKASDQQNFNLLSCNAIGSWHRQ